MGWSRANMRRPPQAQLSGKIRPSALALRNKREGLQCSVLRSRGFEFAFDQMKFASTHLAKSREMSGFTAPARAGGRPGGSNRARVRWGVNGRVSNWKPNRVHLAIDTLARVAANSLTLPSPPKTRADVFRSERIPVRGIPESPVPRLRTVCNAPTICSSFAAIRVSQKFQCHVQIFRPYPFHLRRDPAQFVQKQLPTSRELHWGWRWQ